MAKKTDDLSAVLEKIGGMESQRDTAERLHEIILRAAPDLQPRLWYGMPGYAKAKSSPVICFFRVDDGLMTFGITEKANLARPEGHLLIEAAWFLQGLDEPTEARISEIVRSAAQ